MTAGWPGTSWLRQRSPRGVPFKCCSVYGVCRIRVGCWHRYVQMALKLLYERQLKKDSRLAHYVENLPGSFSSPLAWTEAELAALQYPHLQEEVHASSASHHSYHVSVSFPALSLRSNSLLALPECAQPISTAAC